jgi:hypothetical protein
MLLLSDLVHPSWRDSAAGAAIVALSLCVVCRLHLQAGQLAGNFRENTT